jgi:DNA-binding transcriptional LysR family regulator
VVCIAAIPAVMALLLPEVITNYIDAYPGVDINMREENAKGVQTRILRGEVDFGISTLWTQEPELAFEPLFDDYYGVIVGSDHPFAVCKSEITWEDLSKMQVLGFSADLGMQQQLAKMPNIPQHIRYPRYQTSNTSTIEALVRAGRGVSVMSALAAQRPPLDNLTLKLLHDPACFSTVGILSRKGRSLPPAAEDLRDRIRQRAPGLARFKGIRVHK